MSAREQEEILERLDVLEAKAQQDGLKKRSGSGPWRGV